MRISTFETPVEFCMFLGESKADYIRHMQNAHARSETGIIYKYQQNSIGALIQYKIQPFVY